MTALERAARALCRSYYSADYEEIEVIALCETEWADWVGDARAVLMAVREPSVDMSEAIMQNFADPCWPEDAKQGFTAMIDAILNEKDTTND